MTIVIGLWAVPLLITIVSVAWWFWWIDQGSKDAVSLIFVGPLCVFVAMLSWLLWALLA